MTSPLHSMHVLLSQVNTNHTYLGVAEQVPDQLIATPTKTLHLKRAYEIAQLQVLHLLEIDTSPLTEKIAHLQELQTDGDNAFLRYSLKTKTWSRRLLKGLEYYAPRFLKVILPQIFANGIRNSEIETELAYRAFGDLLHRNIVDLTRQAPQRPIQIRPPLFENDHPPLPPLTDLPDLFGPENHFETLTQDELDLMDSQIMAYILEMSEREANQPIDTPRVDTPRLVPQEEGIAPQVEEPAQQGPNLNQLVTALDRIRELKRRIAEEAVDERARRLGQQVTLNAQARLTQRQETAINQNRTAATKIITRLNETSRTLLTFEKFKDSLVKLEYHLNMLYTLSPNLNKEDILRDVGMDPTLIPVFLNTSFATLLFSGRFDEVAALLNPTSWGQAYAESSKQSYMQVIVRKGMGTDFLTFHKDGRPYRESEARNYNGQIRFNLSDLELVNNFLTNHGTCQPYSIEVTFSEEDSLTPDFFKQMLELSRRVPDVTIKGISTIDFAAMNLSADDEKMMIENLSKLSFSGLNSITLANNDKSSIAPEHFSNLLQVCPNIDLMKACLLACSEPKKIDLPLSLLARKQLDLAGYPFDLIEHLLSKFEDLEFLLLDQDEVTPAFLQHIHEQGYLNSIQGLTLSNCRNLTTDALFTLTMLPSLTILEAPNFQQGERPLSELPKSNNPFKINMFYTQSDITRPLALSLYTGLHMWATRFQIPLARSGVAEVFAPHHLVLDPYSVACWLHKNDYQHLQPQTAVQTVIADSSAQLNDDNIVEFLQKFPNIQELSLHNCPGITNVGLKALIEACPQLKKIDLTSCLGITNEFLLENHTLLQQRPALQLDLSDTSITLDIANIFSEELNGRISFEVKSLKIKNDELTDDNALERILNAQPVNRLHRLDLEDCTNLTDEALGKLLDRLNADQRQQDQDGSWNENPQRLNIAILNLKGCTAITDKAFDGVEQEGKISPKILNSLSQIAVGGTQLTTTPSILLAGLYPRIVFQEELAPITMALAINEQLYDTENSNYIKNRIALELFPEEAADGQEAFEVIRKPVDIQADCFKDFTLSFAMTEEGARTLTTHTYRDLIYSQSGHFRRQMRAGGEMMESTSIDLINQNATVLASRALVDLIGKEIYQDLDWKTAGQTAELASEATLQLPAVHYSKLLNHIHSQFNLARADKMLVLATKLNDKAGKELYEQQLIQLAETRFDLLKVELQRISQNHGLINLANKLTEIAIQKAQQDYILDRQAGDALSLLLAQRLEQEDNAENMDADLRLALQLSQQERV